MHWTLDVCFSDDQSRIRKGNATQNVTAIKRLALNLLKITAPLVSERMSFEKLPVGNLALWT